MNTNPPTILKIGEKRATKYSLNYDHPELSNLLTVIHLHSHNSDTLHIFDACENEDPFASFMVITPSAPRTDRAIVAELMALVDTCGNRLSLESELMIMMEAIMNAKMRAYVAQAINDGKVKKEDVILLDGDKKALNMDNATVLELLQRVRHEDLTIQINSLYPRYKNK